MAKTYHISQIIKFILQNEGLNYDLSFFSDCDRWNDCMSELAKNKEYEDSMYMDFDVPLFHTGFRDFSIVTLDAVELKYIKSSRSNNDNQNYFFNILGKYVDTSDIDKLLFVYGLEVDYLSFEPVKLKVIYHV